MEEVERLAFQVLILLIPLGFAQDESFGGWGQRTLKLYPATKVHTRSPDCVEPSSCQLGSWVTCLAK